LDGCPLQAFTGGNGGDRRAEYLLTEKARGGETFEFYLEVACNGMFGNGLNGQIEPPDPNRYFTLQTAELIVLNAPVRELWWDFQVIAGLAKEFPADSQRASEALMAANDIVNAFIPDDETSWLKALEIAKGFFGRYPKNEATHQITAVAHAHLDTCWLWPYDETKRKAARTCSTQIGLMERYPDFTFVYSQMQQLEWLKELYPKLWEKIKVKAAEGQFIPVGGTWVEQDCNLPCGESFVRQFLFGQRFLQANFGHRSDVFWLPDTFGYSAQLPQIVKQSGVKYFLTQKLSWNNINKFPYTTFEWVGLDGTAVLTHFPPMDDYCSKGTAKEMLFAVRNHKDKDYTNKSMMLYGFGDGGSGANADMVERITRMKNQEGLPALKFGNPSEFFAEVEKESRNLAQWHGELYFELHRGTYTSQARTKVRLCSRNHTIQISAV
jgi:alpha-mannosidase